MVKYPRVREIKHKANNTSAKCECGKVGRYKTTIEVNYFRGDDESYWRCDEHKSKVAVNDI